MRIFQIYEFNKGFALVLKISHFTLILVIWASFWEDKMTIEYTVPEQPRVEFDTPLFKYTVPEQPRVNWMTSER